MEAGNPVQFEQNEDVVIIGEVMDVDRVEQLASVQEAHAYHRLWGGSNVRRGDLHEVPVEQLKPATPQNARIIREALPKWREKHATPSDPEE
jgi:hypothetical protein